MRETSKKGEGEEEELEEDGDVVEVDREGDELDGDTEDVEEGDTKEDVDDKTRKTNLINTFSKMFDYGVIPVINENDCVAVDEVVYGDNDTLSAVVAKLVGADLLIILTDAQGLYDKDPSASKDAKLIPVVKNITPEHVNAAGGAGSKRGTGGMVTKLHAAQIATDAGIDTVVMNGEYPQKIYKLLDGASIGTLFEKHGE